MSLRQENDLDVALLPRPVGERPMSGNIPINKIIPVVLFVYARPNHLKKTLECLRANNIQFLYVFSDGPRTPDKEQLVAAVREIIRAIDWCEVVLSEQQENLGLGVSIRSGVTEVFRKHETVIVFEDDLICVPGTYEYLSSALNHYCDDPKVMSVTGWTHPSVTPRNVGNQPYFDGRAECLVWGTWRRVWQGMDSDAATLMNAAKRRGLPPDRYGADLPVMAAMEQKQNIWAVRFLYLHILNDGLCMRPPWSMVEHIGFDAEATNASDGSRWSNPVLKQCPPVPTEWPAAHENPVCAQLWRAAISPKTWKRNLILRAIKKLHRVVSASR